MTGDDQIEVDVLAAALADKKYMKAAVATLPSYTFRDANRSWIWRMASTSFRNDGELPSATDYGRWATRDFHDSDKRDSIKRALISLHSSKPKTPKIALAELGKVARIMAVRAGTYGVAEAIERNDLKGAEEAWHDTGKLLNSHGPAELVTLDNFEQRAGTYLSGVAFPVFQTPWPTVNLLVAGGLRIGNIGVMAGFTGTGKSAVATDLSYAALSRDRRCVVLHIPIEETVEELTARFDARVSSIDRIRLTSGQLTQHEHDQMITAFRLHADLLPRLRIGSIESNSMSSIRALAEQMRSDYPDSKMLIIIDSPDDLIPTGKSQDRRHSVDMVVQAIKDIVRDKGLAPCAVWATTQGNRESGKKNDIDLLSPSESLSKSRIAGIVLGMRDGELLPNETRQMQVVIRKNRQGPVKHFNLDVTAHLGTCEFSETGNPNQATP